MRKFFDALADMANPYGKDVHQFPEVAISDHESIFIKVMEKQGAQRLVFCYKEKEHRDVDIEYADMDPQSVDHLIAMLESVKDYLSGSAISAASFKQQSETF